MKLLADENIPLASVRGLRELGQGGSPAATLQTAFAARNPLLLVTVKLALS